MRLSTVLPIFAFAMLAVVLGVYLHQIGTGEKSASDVPSVLIGKPVPPFDLPPIAGMTDGLKSADLHGKVAMVNFFASWCPPCHQEHPLLIQLARAGVTIYGINHKDEPEAALGFLDRLGDPYRRIGADSTGRVSIDWGVRGYPETFVVDRSGVIRYKHVGPLLADQLNDRILPLLEELGR